MHQPKNPNGDKVDCDNQIQKGRFAYTIENENAGEISPGETMP